MFAWAFFEPVLVKEAPNVGFVRTVLGFLEPFWAFRNFFFLKQFEHFSDILNLVLSESRLGLLDPF